MTDIDGRRPYVQDEDVCVMGIRDEDEYLIEVRQSEIQVWTVTDLRSQGLSGVETGLSRLERGSLDAFWIHLDVDVLDAQIMPAVDTPTPGGMDHDELRDLLGILVASPRCFGLNVTVFDPDLDPEGVLATKLTETLVTAISKGIVWKPRIARSSTEKGRPG